LRNDVSAQLLNDVRRRALSVLEIEDNVVHPDFLKRLQQSPEVVTSEPEPQMNLFSSFGSAELAAK